MRRQPRQFNRAFSLVELLVVVAIITGLLTIALPALQNVRENGRRTTCMSHLQQIGLALCTYHTSLEAFPIGSTDQKKKKLSWCIYLLPYLDRKAVFDLFKFDLA